MHNADRRKYVARAVLSTKLQPLLVADLSLALLVEIIASTECAMHLRMEKYDKTLTLAEQWALAKALRESRGDLRA